MIRKPTRCRSAPLIALLALLAVHAVQAAPLYDVEVIIFSRTGGGDDEVVNGPGGAAALAGGAYPGGEVTELSPGQYRLNNIRGGLAAARGYHVLFHRAWRQPGDERAHAAGYPVHVLSDNRRDGVDGTITLIRERYLHLDLDLWLTPAGSRPAYHLAEKRRIRSDELHYFDNPRFGVIARVTPYQEPEAPASDAPSVPEDAAAAGGQEEEPVAPAQDPLTR